MTARRPIVFSDRERECIQLAARGHSDTDIGRKLGLSGKTVNAYIERVKIKLGVDTRVEAIVLAVKAGLIHVLGLMVLAAQSDDLCDLVQSFDVVPTAMF